MSSHVLWLLVTLACGTTPIEGRRETVAEVPGNFEDQVESAARLAADLPDQRVRFNPVRCPCPLFEVRLAKLDTFGAISGERWVRVALEGSDDPDSAAGKLFTRARQEEAQEPPPTYRVFGDLSTSARRCGQGALYLTLGVDRFE